MSWFRVALRVAQFYGIVMLSGCLVALGSIFLVAHHHGVSEVRLALDMVGEQVVETVLLTFGVFLGGFAVADYMWRLRRERDG